MNIRHLAMCRREVFIARVPLDTCQGIQKRNQPMDRVIQRLRKSAVTLDTVYLQAGVGGTAPADTHGIAQFLSAAGFTDEAPGRHAAALFEDLGDTLDTINGLALLITGQQDAHLPGMIGVFAHHGFGGNDHGRHAAFHIGGAAPVQDIVPDNGLERRRGPVFNRPGWHHVGMAKKPQRRLIRRVGTAMRNQDIADFTKRQPLNLEALRLQALCQ